MTPVSRIGSRIRALERASIWGAGSIGLQDARVARLLRRTIPEFYMACAIFGGLGAIGGIPALRQTFGESFATLIGIGIAASALVAGAGEAFPARLWRLEFYAAHVLSGMIILYAVAVLVASFTVVDVGRAAVSFAIYAMSSLVRWRVVDIARDRSVNGWR